MSDLSQKTTVSSRLKTSSATSSISGLSRNSSAVVGPANRKQPMPKSPHPTRSTSSRIRPPSTTARISQTRPNHDLTSTVRAPPPTSRLAQTTSKLQQTNSSKLTVIPARGGLARYNNPIECQRIIADLKKKIDDYDKIVSDKDKALEETNKQLKLVDRAAIVYAIMAQRFSDRLKLFSKPNLEDQCRIYEENVRMVEKTAVASESKLKTIIEQYKEDLKNDQILRQQTESALDRLNQDHTDELARVHEECRVKLEKQKEEFQEHSNILQSKLDELEEELKKSNAIAKDLKRQQEFLIEAKESLEEALADVKDAGVRIARKKAEKLEKEVNSLQAVLEMKTDQIRSLEKENVVIDEITKELAKMCEQNKTLKQQLEADQVALNNKRQEIENANEQIISLTQKLAKAEADRVKISRKTEELKYYLDENDKSLLALDDVDTQD